MGLLDMTPQQYGLLAAGLGMMGNSRGRSLGESLASGGMQGLTAMASSQQAQQMQDFKELQMSQLQRQMQRQDAQDRRESAFRSSLQGIDQNDTGALAKALMDAGLYEDAVRLRSPKRDGIPTGFVGKEDGSIEPMPISGGGNYMDYQINLANQKAQMPGYGEAERLGLAMENNARDREKFNSEMAQKDRQLSNAEFQSNLANWKLLNPNYDKNIATIQKSRADYEKLKNGLDTYIETLDKFGQLDRHNPLTNADLQTAYQNATYALRGEDLMNSGVLNPGEIPMLNKALQDPTVIFSAGGWRDTGELKKQRDILLQNATKNVNSKVKELLPQTPPPTRGDALDLNSFYIPEWKPVNADAEIKSLRNSGDNKAADELEKMKRREELRKRHGVSQ